MFAFYVITFEPIKIQTYSAPQNDRLNLSFVKEWPDMVVNQHGYFCACLKTIWNYGDKYAKY